MSSLARIKETITFGTPDYWILLKMLLSVMAWRR